MTPKLKPAKPKRRPTFDAPLEALERARIHVRLETRDTFKFAIDQAGLSFRQIARRIGTATPDSAMRTTHGGNLTLELMSDVAFAMGKKVKVTLEDL
jgi:hypothetical protein